MPIPKGIRFFTEMNDLGLEYLKALVVANAPVRAISCQQAGSLSDLREGDWKHVQSAFLASVGGFDTNVVVSTDFERFYTEHMRNVAIVQKCKPDCGEQVPEGFETVICPSCLTPKEFADWLCES